MSGRAVELLPHHLRPQLLQGLTENRVGVDFLQDLTAEIPTCLHKKTPTKLKECGAGKVLFLDLYVALAI